MTLARFCRVLHQRLRSIAATSAVDAETARELRFHFDQLVGEYIGNGMTPEAAQRAARLRLGNIPALEDACRDQRRVGWLRDLRHDVAYGIRLLRRTPGFTAVAAVSLALGIGANAATLSAIRAVRFESLPFPDGDRLVILSTFALENPVPGSHMSLPEFVVIKDTTSAFESMGVSIADQADLGADEHEPTAERLVGLLADPELFATLGVQPLIGRGLTIDQPRGLVISYDLWQRRFGGSPDIVGRSVRLNGSATTVLGVMPSGFEYANERVEYWRPLKVTRDAPPEAARYYTVVARLKAGVSQAEADADLQRVTERFAERFPARRMRWAARLEPLREAWYDWTTAPLATLQVASVLVLLIACANVAGLLLARGTARAPEIALRMSLGASRGRIVRQLTTESVILSMFGGLLGVVVAWFGVRAMAWLRPVPGSARIPELSVDGSVVALLVLLSIASGVAFGLVPAQLCGRSAHARLSAGGRTVSARGVRFRGVLVSVQIALALVLLIGTGLLLNSFIRLNNRDINYDPRGLWTLGYRIPPATYLRSIGSYKGYPYYQANPPPAPTIERVYARLQQLPGVAEVAGISHTPTATVLVPRVDLSADTASPDASHPSRLEAANIVFFIVTPNVFATMRTPVVRGREFLESDTLSTPWVVVVNEALARTLWGDGDPLGREILLDIVPEEQPRRVIGVVRDVPLGLTQTRAEPIAYLSYRQQPGRTRGPWPNTAGQMTFLVRSAADPASVIQAAQRAVAEIDPDRPLANILPLDRLLTTAVLERHTVGLVIGVYAVASTILAAIGIYGVMAYTVSHRTREIGLRIALGADRGRIATLVSGSALPVVAVGLVAGVAASLALSRLIRAQLWGVTPTDPLTFAAVSLLMTTVALLACVLPVRRALRVDPASALKNE
jgi:putative ABC transport system permease protein